VILRRAAGQDKTTVVTTGPLAGPEDGETTALLVARSD
jgi:hypothetical protein